jgi:dihydropteroate synthase
MGIVNITPDSFSDGGLYADTFRALAHARQLVDEGARILDVGAESSRPGAQAVPLELELQRLFPVVQELVTWGLPISVDTYKPEVMQRMLDLGVDIINDIFAMRWKSLSFGKTAQQVVSEHPSCGVCLMHMHGEPEGMHLAPMTGDVVSQVGAFLKNQATSLVAMGVERNRVVVDPGIGFGKTVEQNFELLKAQRQLLFDEFILMVGWSRKSSLGAVLHDASYQWAHPRAAASVAAALLAVERGARIVRVHDVKPTVDALNIFNAIA